MIKAVWAIVSAIGLMSILILTNKPGGVTFIVVLALYFLPAIIAAVREHMNAGAILAFNFFLGWTILGWILAFVWACTNNRQTQEA